MGMGSHTRPDGKRETTTDFPYYLSKGKAKYYQPRSLEEARVEAQNFANYIKARRGGEVTITEYPDKQSIHVVEVGD